jgi:hypothetical protein
MLHAPCPIPHAPCPMRYAPCPMPHALTLRCPKNGEECNACKATICINLEVIMINLMKSAGCSFSGGAEAAG